jgi:8-oxo-dGTP diphosphatase
MPTGVPRLGVSVILFQDGAVLLVRRGQAPWQGAWSLPGGGIERDELPQDAALRELKEETGIVAAIEGLLETIELDAEDASGRVRKYRLSVFHGRAVGGALGAGSDAAAARWVRLEDLDGLRMTEGTASLIRRAAGRLA